MLKQPDVTVTNASNKELQHEILVQLDALVRRLDASCYGEALPLVVRIEHAVGPKPTGRTCRDEWVDAWMKRDRLLGGI